MDEAPQAEAGQSPFLAALFALEERLQKAAVYLNEIASQVEELGQTASEQTAIPPKEVAVALFSISAVHEDLDRQIKRLYHVKDAFNKHIVPSRIELAGLDMIRVPELARSFSVQEKLSASFIDKDAGFAWLREIGQGDIIQETVNAGTLSSFVRNMILEEGKDPPETIVQVSTYKTVSIAKYNPASKATKRK